MKKIVIISLLLLGIFIPSFFVLAATGTIDATYKYAWANKIGWINFGCDDCNVQITDSVITGYAWAENLGWINLSPTGGGGITNNNGDLSGSAWGEDTGWIDFDGVTINSSGQFTGTATGDVSGTVVFTDCGSDCGVTTDWLPSSGGGGDGGGGTYGQPTYHNVCSNNQCVSASGAGTNLCQTREDCTSSSHYECQSQRCVLFDGDGVNQCSIDTECLLPKHNECQNNQCILVNGDGFNLCQTWQDCVFKHGVCQDQRCVQINGIGVNQCQNDLNCTTPKHNVCQNQQCVAVDGAGINSCQNVDDCQGAPVILQKHSVCQNQRCISVDGQGVSTCQSDDQCKTSAVPPGQNPPVNIPPINIPPIITEGVGKIITNTISGTNNFIQTTQGEIVATTLSAMGVVGGLLSALSIMIFAPGVIFEIFFIPFRLASLLMAVTGIRKKVVHWGVVYDSQTKQPLDPVRVSLSNMEGKEIASTITDVDGRYGFLVDPGMYKISAKKTHYDFPSKKLAGKTTDEIYEHLYFGEQLEIKEKGEVIKNDIPLDPLGFDWNEFAKSHAGLMKFYSKFDASTRVLSDVIFAVGFVISLWAFFAAPKPYNVAILVLYFALLALRLFVFKPKSFGSVTRRADGQPLSFAILKIVSSSLNVEVGHKVADAFGRYYCLIPKGKYYVKIEEKEPDDSYKEVYKSEVINASGKGIIKNNFKV